MSFNVYSRIGNRYFSFDQKKHAEEFYQQFPGDALLLEGAQVLDSKAVVKTFTDVIRTCIFLQHRILAEPLQKDVAIYETVINVMKTEKTGVLLTGDIGVGKGTLMKTITMCAASHVIGDITPFPVVELRDLALLYSEYQHRAFEMLGMGAAQPQVICLDNIVEEYIHRQHYRERVNVLGEFVEERYALFERSGIPTHMVTNLTVEQLAENLGDRRYQLMLRLITQVQMTGESKNV